MTSDSRRIDVEGETIHADVGRPPDAKGVILFAHGSGSGRHSPRNQFVARFLQAHGWATVLADLLTAAEEASDAITGQYRFDIDLLGRRMIGLITWVRAEPNLGVLPVGVFGASTGAAAALLAAAQRPDDVGAVVARGGRPDLAGSWLALVQAPTLLIVGGADVGVLDLNRLAQAAMHCPTALEVVPGATHLFEEPGALETVAQRAERWFSRHLVVPSEPGSQS